MNSKILTQIKQLKMMLADARRVAFLGGAGTSTESGIPDFRSSDGIFQAIQQFGYPPETLLSHEFFMHHTEVFFEYYRKFLLVPNARPNQAHKALARLEQAGKLTAVITQNIDDLHQQAGSRHVLELHGSVYRNHCMKCGRIYSLSEILPMNNVPRCACGGLIKPDVVLYGESLDSEVLQSAVTHISRADMLIIGGTSLVVYPAAGLADYFTGKNLVVINLTETHQDARAQLTICAPIGEVLMAAVPE
ncbi:MAG: NAD-dependent protein deacylase [Clostridia bacterium]